MVADGSPAVPKIPERCPACAAPSVAEARFCDSCGADLRAAHCTGTVRCTACRAVRTPGALFCDACGASVSSPRANRRRRAGSTAGRLLMVFTVAILGAAVTLASTSLLRRDPHQAVEDPTARVATATMAHLAGPGAVLDRRHQAAAAVLAQSRPPDAATCEATRTAVAQAGSVEVVLVAIESVPDEGLRELEIGAFAAESAVLNACGAATAPAMREALRDVERYHEALAARRALVQREAMR